MPTTESSRKTLYLIDGSAYIYRAFFALPALNNSQGLQTNAILGFTTTLLKILRERKPDGLVVAFDEKGPTLRHAEFKAYKAQRPPMPEGMSAQIPYIHRVVDALNIPAVRQAGHEADDLIGTLAHQAEQAGFDVVIVTAPDVGSRYPFMWRSTVDFPAPFAPTMPTDSPWVIRNETPFSASVPSGYRKRTSLNSRR